MGKRDRAELAGRQFLSALLVCAPRKFAARVVAPISHQG
jgi:hypothetical protein